MRMQRLLNLPVLALALVPTLATGQEVASISEDQFVAWVRETAIPLDSLDWLEVDLHPLGGLEEALAGKRIVYLGEPDHFIREKMDYRLLMIRYLHTLGFRHVGMEQGRSDGKRIDRYLETGDEECLGRVAIYGYDGYVREDRDDAVPGWTGGKNSAFREKAQEGAFWFVREMRRFNEMLGLSEKRLTYFGYDVSMKPGGSYVDARVKGETRQEEAARLDALVQFMAVREPEVLVLLGQADMRELRRTLICLAEGLRFVDGFIGPFSTDQKHATLRRRETNMHRQMDEVLEFSTPDDKFILLGHDLHLSRESGRIEWEGRKMWPSIGTHLSHTRPDEIYSVWLLFDIGYHGEPMANEPLRRIRGRSGDVERLLGKAGDLYFLPLADNDPRASFLDEPRELLCGGFRPRCVLREQADAVFFVKEVSPQEGR